MSDLKGKTILVTGGSRGIGAGVARYLADSGARVAITYSTQADAADGVINEMPGEGHFALKMDISSEESVNNGISKVIEEFGGLDGLVNNAGITRDQLLLRMKSGDFDDVIQTNLRGTFLCSKAVLKPMFKARAGSIVNITSVIGQKGNPGQTNYAASKAGVEAFSKSMAQEVGSRGVRINCVAPGFIVTAMTDSLDDKQKEAILDQLPLKRLGQVEDVAHAVGFLLSNDASYITGQTISVNGGMYM